MHFHRKFFRVYSSYPRATQLHVDQQIERLIERKLPFFVCFDAGIGESMRIIDIECNAVRIHFYRIYIVVIGIDRTYGV